MGARALLLGLDGATFRVIDALGDQLPNLSRLSRQGSRAVLRSTTPPMTLPAWSSIITGVGPGTHGIYDFLRRCSGRYALEFQHAGHRRVPTIFKLLSDRGHRVCSVAMPTTWPPETLDGVMIAGFDSPVATTAEAMHCQPRALWEQIERRFGGLAFAGAQEGDTRGDWHARMLPRLLREIARKEALCRWLLDREEWTLFSVVFGEPDTVAHHYWAFADQRSPRHVPSDDPALRGAIAEVYRRLDWAVGELASRAELVCVASDHGFGGASDLVVYINRYLESVGLLASRPGVAAPGDRLRALATRLPVERLVRRVPAVLLGEAETLARYGDIDFSRTRAWSDELNYAATVHLNRRGRDPEGLDVAEDEVIDALLGWRVEGHPVVTRVHRADELWGRARAPGAPDLVLELASRGGYSPVVLPSARVPVGTTWRRLEAPEYLGAKGLGMNGSHRPEGVLLIGGRGAGELGEASVIDVMPTLLAALGEPIPAHVEGRSLLPELGGRVPGCAVATRGSLKLAQSRQLSDRLRALGYL